MPSSEIHAKLLYEIEKVKSVFPLDDALGISRLPFKMTVPVMLEVAFESITCESFEDAQQKLKRAFNIEINDDTMRKVTNYLGSFVYQNDCEEANLIIDKLNHGRLKFHTNKINHTQYFEVDGAMLATRNNDNKGTIYKENKLGMIFSSDNFRWWTDKNGKRQHEILKKEFISLIGDSDLFSKLFFATAIRNGYGNYKNNVLLSDGATWIRLMKEKYFPDCQQILDFYHLKEHISDYSKIIFNGHEEDYRPWTEEVSKLFKQSETNKAINMIIKDTKTKYKVQLNSVLTYLKNNESNIDYATYRKNGFFIGSGAIESANKVVLQRRLKFGPMIWKIDSSQAVVTLVAKLRSGLWMTDVVRPTYQKFGEPFSSIKTFGISRC
jgi:hypothetical protein